MKTERNPLKWPPLYHLILTVTIVIFGAVFRKGHPDVGHWITVAGLGWYLIITLVPAIQAAAGFSGLTGREKAHLLIVGGMLLIFVLAIFRTSAVSYFLIIVLLAIEYLLLKPEQAGEKPE